MSDEFLDAIYTCKEIIEGVWKRIGEVHPTSTKDMVDVYLYPAKEHVKQKRAQWSAWLNEALIGEHVASAEVKPGIWEHTFTPQMRTFIPVTYTDALMRSLIDDLSMSPVWKAHHARMRQQRTCYKRKIKQHRAAFRRKKRGLA